MRRRPFSHFHVPFFHFHDSHLVNSPSWFPHLALLQGEGQRGNCEDRDTPTSYDQLVGQRAPTSHILIYILQATKGHIFQMIIETDMQMDKMNEDLLPSPRACFLCLSVSPCMWLLFLSLVFLCKYAFSQQSGPLTPV